jgi:Holliday junction resolvasome RuvABC endonuclease subunit
VSLKKLAARPGFTRVMGIDASSQSFAYSVFQDKVPVEWGILKYTGKDRFERAVDSYYKVKALMERLDVEYILQEQAVGSVNQQTGLILAQAYGVTMPILIENSHQYDMVSPNEWQALLNRKIMTPTQIKKAFPDEKPHFYTEKARHLRKQRNLDWVNDNLGISLPYEANDVGDALCIGAKAAGLI